MPVTLDERMRYHPDPNREESTRWSKRRVEDRCKLIADRVDFCGKRVIDLGCSGGYFGFQLANVVSSYLGIDADGDLIERNRNIARQRTLKNLHFQHVEITPSFIRRLASTDVALFLSVFHHILTASSAYEWNHSYGYDPFDLLRALSERVEVLIFETGYPNEGFEWCERLPAMDPTPREWIMRILRDAGFSDVEVIPARAYHGPMSGLRRRLATRLGYATHPRPIMGQIASHLLRVDPRDNRDLFVARVGIRQRDGQRECTSNARHNLDSTGSTCLVNDHSLPDSHRIRLSH